MDELLDQFLIESRELTQRAGDELLALEASPRDRERLDGAFRAIHTLKGSTALFDLAPLTEMLHAAEDLLAALRAGAITADIEIVEALLAAVNQSDRWIDTYEQGGELPSDAARVGSVLRQRLLGARAGPATTEGRADLAAGQEIPAWAPPLFEACEREIGPGAARLAIRYTPSADCFFSGDDPLAIAQAVPGLIYLSLQPREPWPAAGALDPFHCNLVLDLVSDAPAGEVRTALRLVGDQIEVVEASDEAEASGGDMPLADVAAARTLRVEASRLDALAEIVDELVVAKNALAHLAARADEGLAGRALAQGVLAHYTSLDRLVGRLHRTVMGARMAPLAPLFRRFPRLVREIAGRLARPVDFSVAGESVEVDKTVMDGLYEPLLHLVRNALDHGVEPAAAREAAGKPDRAALSLTARREGDQVIIEVADDGRGIDAEHIRHIALERGLISAEAAEALDEERTLDLIFLPGFSTAGTVSDLSGRGVGMDAVRTAVGRLGGRLNLSTIRGAGTRVTLSLPMAMVMTRVMVVRCGTERFGVPMDEVTETVRVSDDQVVAVREGRAFVLREQPLPLFDLGDLLGAPPAATRMDQRTVLVTGNDGNAAAIAVDAVEDRIDVVLRPTTGLLARMRGVAGATLTGDGEVLMVLDLAELIG